MRGEIKTTNYERENEIITDEITKGLNKLSQYNTDLKTKITQILKKNIELNIEIARLKLENEILSKNADTAFQDGLNEAQDLYAEQVKAEIKAEAIQEFAEHLKEKWSNNDYYSPDVDFDEFVDNSLKEMAGEE